MVMSTDALFPELSACSMTDDGHYLLDDTDRQIITFLQTGLPISSRPYQVIAQQLGVSEHQVVQRIKHLNATDCIKRLGVIVRHHELGYQANAMVVWDVPDKEVDEVGDCFSKYEYVTLCYQRPRHLPAWRYNLFSMIHGQSRSEVLQRIEEMNVKCHASFPHQALFSQRRFKQRGALHPIKTDISLHIESQNKLGSGA